ncbi:MAG: hypothetical protein AB4911_03160 [Oscillochloridaceae bacterium umkhey_bin13]
MSRSMRLIGVLGVALLIGLAVMPATITTAQSRLCFGEVPDCIEGRFAEYWQQNGGLPVFGFPIGPARMERVGDRELLVKPFERNRFELHPDKARPYDVLLGWLGDDRLRQLGRPWEQEPKAATTSQSGCQYFSETGHLVCEPFLSYWRTHGLDLDGRRGFTVPENLALFGLPLTEARMEPASEQALALLALPHGSLDAARPSALRAELYTLQGHAFARLEQHAAAQQAYAEALA